MRRLFNIAAVLLVALPVLAGITLVEGGSEGLDREVVEPTLGRAQLARYQSPSEDALATPGLPILSYHDIRPDADDPFTVSPEQFADHMAMLDAAGFRTITLDELSAYLDGGALPPRSILLTFDDGTSGVWRYADSVLERHGFHGVVFVITAQIGERRPYYMNWEELEQLARTGRFELQSHTHDSHVRIPTGPGGEVGPALTNREWLPDADRYESHSEYERRVTTDLDASLRALAEHGIDAADQYFAFPFSAASTPTNDPTVVPILRRAVTSRFRASMINVEPDRFAVPQDAEVAELPRMEVFASTSTDQLFARLQGAEPLPLASTPLLSTPELWSIHGGVPDAVTFEGGRLSTAPPENQASVSLFYGEGRTEGWHDYRVEVAVGGLSADTASTAGLVALAGSEDQIRVTVSHGWARVYHGLGARTDVIFDAAIPSGKQHRLAVEVAGGRVSAGVDGRRLALADPSAGERTTGGVGLTVHRPDDGAPPITFTSMTIADRASD